MIFDERTYLINYPDVAKAIADGLFVNGFDHYARYGKSEGRTDSLILNSRAQKVLEGINLTDGLGLEIGPSHNPIAPKSNGYNVEIIDHMDKAGLVKKYSSHDGIDVSKIEDVDYVWDGRPLAEVVGDKDRYDWIVASHVIEHTPCLVTFLQQCQHLLKDDGILSLVIPDKRYCFDYLNEISSIAEVLDSFIIGRVRPSPGKIYEYLANAVKLNGKIAWSQHDRSKDFSLIHDANEAKSIYEKSQNTEEYHDVHVWRFIPESFIFILEELKFLGLVNFSIHKKFDTSGCEFYVKLRKECLISTSHRQRLEELISIRDVLKK